MRRFAVIVGTFLFMFVGPGVVAGVVPWWITHWVLAASWAGVWSRTAGGLLIVAGGAALLDCFIQFALKGLGAPAPAFPAKRLVVSGLYLWVRNPMYLALVAVILGQALLFASFPLLAYSAAVGLAAHLFVVAYEEPRLRRIFPADYGAYCKAVPRWRPRLTPWPGAAWPELSTEPDS